MRTSIIWATLALVASAGVAMGGETKRVSVTTGGAEGSEDSGTLGVCANRNGRFIAFDSQSDLEAGKGRGVYMHDNLLGLTFMVSLSTGGGAINGQRGVISADAHFLAFEAFDGGSNHFQILMRDLVNGETRVPSFQGTGTSRSAALSGDGKLLVFQSDAENLVLGDTNGAPDIFLYDWVQNTITRVSVATGGAQANGLSELPTISADGRFVAFTSYADNLVPGDTNGTPDVFVRDLVAGTTTRVSTTSTGQQADDMSTFAGLSADGGKVVFQSLASNFDGSVDHGNWDVFVKDLASGSVTRVSVGLNGEPGNASSCNPSMSADGTRVAFASFASNLVPGDNNGVCDTFIRDLDLKVTTRVSVAGDGTEGSLESGLLGVSLSDDGCVVAFQSDAPNLVANDTNGKSDVFANNTCDSIAQNYGPGWPGSLGVPDLTGIGNPDLCTTMTVSVANSAGQATAATLFFGVRPASLPTPWDGQLLVMPIASFFLDLPVGGLVVPGSVPCDPAFKGVHVFLQALEIDAGASRGIAFTRGLDILFGK